MKHLLMLLFLVTTSAPAGAEDNPLTLDRYFERSCDFYTKSLHARDLREMGYDNTQALAEIDALSYGLGEDTDPLMEQALKNWPRFEQSQRLQQLSVDLIDQKTR